MHFIVRKSLIDNSSAFSINHVQGIVSTRWNNPKVSP